MNQIQLFENVIVGWQSSAKDPVAPGVHEDLWYDDGPGTSVAKYMATVQHPRWDWCTSGVWVTLERHLGYTPHKWMAEVHLELPDHERSYWSAHAIFATQAQAAKEAADMAAVARGLLDAFLRGEPVELPGQRRHRAAEAYADALPECRAAVKFMEAEKAARDALDYDDAEKLYAHRRYLAAKGAAEDLRRRAIDKFCAAHPWREFAEVPHVVR